MKISQRIILLLGLFIITAFCLRPPYLWEETTYRINRESGTPHKAGTTTENAGHRWIWSPPTGITKPSYMVGMSGPALESRVAKMDLSRLGVYVGLTVAFSLFLAFGVFNWQKQ